MYENDYMYAVERDKNSLAHYGIRGMKWGVQRALHREDGKALGKHYAKAMKKLSKLDYQASRAGKYGRRAALMGAGAAAAGAAAATGTEGVAYGMRKLGQFGNKAAVGLGKGMKAVGLKTAGNAVMNAGNKISTPMMQGSLALTRWGKGTGVLKGNSLAYHAVRDSGKGVSNALTKVGARDLGGKLNTAAVKGSNNLYKNGMTNNAAFRIGAGVLGAGLAAGAARNAYKAATAKRKAEKFRAAVNETFKGTKYANAGGNPRWNRNKKKRKG